MATPIWPIEGVALDSTGDLVANSLGDRVVAIQTALGATGGSHLPLFTGDLWYVDAAQPDDTGAGTSPETAKETITAAIALMSAGDAVTVKTGNYTENIDLALDGLELWGEIGAQLTGTLTVSGDTCRVRGMIATPAGADGIVVTGDACIIQNAKVQANPVVAYNVSGAGAILQDCLAIGYSTTAFNIAGNQTNLYRCTAIGSGAATRGFYISAAAADGCVLNDSSSSGNATAGFEIVAGAERNIIKNCVSGGSDGAIVDAGTNTVLGLYEPALSDEIDKIDNAATDGLAGVSNSLAYRVMELERHFHNRERWWGALAGPDETNAIEANVNRPFAAASGVNTWGTAIPICGTDDDPTPGDGDTKFDVHRVLITDLDDDTTPWRLRLIWGTGTSGDAIAADQWTEIIVQSNAVPGNRAGASPADVIMRREDVGVKIWAQVWNVNNGEILSFFYGVHGYEG